MFSVWSLPCPMCSDASFFPLPSAHRLPTSLCRSVPKAHVLTLALSKICWVGSVEEVSGVSNLKPLPSHPSMLDTTCAAAGHRSVQHFLVQ
eukprot:scaffold152858_cov15-Tisochrysis_lutea.AAC.1